MEAIVDFLMSKAGLFSVIATLVAIVAGIQKILTLIRRKSKAKLCFSRVAVEDPPPHSEAGELTFQIMNSGRGTAVLSGLFLKVLDRGPVEEPKMIELAAPLPEYTYKVVLDPPISEYNIRKKEFGTEVALSYQAGEAEAFRVELLSTEPQWYKFQIVAKWYDVEAPRNEHELVSSNLKIEFRPDVRDLLNLNVG